MVVRVIGLIVDGYEEKEEIEVILVVVIRIGFEVWMMEIMDN